jgi:hypothetical protein
MAAIDERIRQLLETVRSSGIGLQGRRYDGDIADLLEEGRTDFAPAAPSRSTSTDPASGLRTASLRAGKSFSTPGEAV